MKDLSKRKMMSTEAVQSGTEEPSTVEKMKTRVRSGEIATFNLLSWATLQDTWCKCLAHFCTAIGESHLNEHLNSNARGRKWARPTSFDKWGERKRRQARPSTT
ncbi:hypothetical protein OUZ56_019799 [Daphnia magna]|uniref:Uncharacterized protein n=1 Tax=Daphnia magna TaxID=35525 RepID=A0ABQ9ZCN4_9CRUS|nr:hypothetical protein OUZ56_019799 [Daphnia magna]